MNPYEIQLDGFVAIYDGEGNWIYKANNPVPLAIKPVEKPAYKVIEEIEKEYSDEFQKMLVAIVKSTAKLLNT